MAAKIRLENILFQLWYYLQQPHYWFSLSVIEMSDPMVVLFCHGCPRAGVFNQWSVKALQVVPHHAFNNIVSLCLSFARPMFTQSQPFGTSPRHDIQSKLSLTQMGSLTKESILCLGKHKSRTASQDWVSGFKSIIKGTLQSLPTRHRLSDACGSAWPLTFYHSLYKTVSTIQP